MYEKKATESTKDTKERKKQWMKQKVKERKLQLKEKGKG